MRASRHMRASRAASLVGVVTLLAACGGSSSTSPDTGGVPVGNATVQATSGLRFTPGTITLAAGGTVTFEFGAVDHDVFFDNDPAGAPANITTPTHNASVTRTFPTAGRFVFNCHIHPGMTGTIVVQ